MELPGRCRNVLNRDEPAEFAAPQHLKPPTFETHYSLTRSFLAAVLALACLPTALSQTLTPQQQALVDKLKSQAQKGIPPSADQLKQLQDMTNGMSKGAINHFGNPAGAKTIPCNVTFTLQYMFKSKNGVTEKRLSMNGTSKGNMTAVINGNADFMKSISGPGASMFTVAPVAGSGYGSLSCHMVVRTHDDTGDHTSTDDFSSSITQGGGGLNLITTGGDALFGSSGFGGVYHSTHTYIHPDKSDSDTGSTSPELFIGFTQESLTPPRSGQPAPKPTMVFSYKDLVAAIQAGASKTFSGSESFSIEKNGGIYTGSSSVSFTINPKPIQLVLEPDSETTYEKWLPLPGTDDNKGFDFKNAAPLKVHLCLSDQTKAGGNVSGSTRTKPNTPVSGKFSIFIHNASSNPGVCMNFPAAGAGPGQSGIYFPKNQPNGIVWDDETHLHTDLPMVEANVIVNARDTGAYGQIEAKCDGLSLQSTVLRTGKQAMDIPMDDNGNHIADDWEKQNSVPSTDPGYDACNQPNTMRPGDGLSLYDKYRGLLIDDGNGTEIFSRIDPTVINLFLYMPGASDGGVNPAGPVGPTPGFPTATPSTTDLKLGAQLFASVSGIKVGYIHSADRLQVLGAGPYPRWITFNQTPYTKDKQCAVVIFDDGKAVDYFDPSDGGGTHEYIGTTMGVNPDQDNSHRDPPMIDHIVIRKIAATNQIGFWTSLMEPAPAGAKPLPLRDSLVGAAKALGLDPVQVAKDAKKNAGGLADELFIFALCHEIGHATGARHHHYNGGGDEDGDPGCPMRYWQADVTAIVMFLSGKWHPSGSAVNGSWQFCSQELPYMGPKPRSSG